jgi:hypothetical protein
MCIEVCMSWNNRNSHNNTHGATIKKKGSIVCSCEYCNLDIGRYHPAGRPLPDGTKLPAIHVFTPTAHCGAHTAHCGAHTASCSIGTPDAAWWRVKLCAVYRLQLGGGYSGIIHKRDLLIMRSFSILPLQLRCTAVLTFICLRATTLSYDVAHRTVRSWRQNSFHRFFALTLEHVT